MVTSCWLRRKTQTISTCSPWTTTVSQLVQRLFPRQGKHPLALPSSSAIRCLFPMHSVAQRTPGQCPLITSRTRAHCERSPQWPPRGAPPFYRVVEIHFPSMGALEAGAASKGCLAISTGGAPTVLIAEEETQVFD